MIWDDAADDILIRLWDETGSLSHVVDELRAAGYPVTKNSVSGRRHRLPREAFKRDMSAHYAERLRPKAPPPRRSHSKKVTPMADEPKKPAIPFAEHKGIEYLDLQPWGCKAIMGGRSEDGWKLQKVCGLRRYGESPYCRNHLKLYTSPERRHGQAS